MSGTNVYRYFILESNTLESTTHSLSETEGWCSWEAILSLLCLFVHTTYMYVYRYIRHNITWIIIDLVYSIHIVNIWFIQKLWYYCDLQKYFKVHPQFREQKGKQDYVWRSEVLTGLKYWLEIENSLLKLLILFLHCELLRRETVSMSVLATNTTGLDAEGSLLAVSVHYCNTQVQSYELWRDFSFILLLSIIPLAFNKIHISWLLMDVSTNITVSSILIILYFLSSCLYLRQIYCKD